MELFTDYTIRTVALGALMLGIVGGGIGAYAVLRRQSLLGDAISHAALPGICISFVLTGSKDPFWLVLGAAVAGWLATLWVMSITRTTRIKYDAALGLVLSVFFGLGIVLLTFIQRQPDAAQAGLDKFLFGQAAGVLARDLWVMAALGSVAILAVVLFWKEFKLLCFDRDYGRTLGLPMNLLDVLLTSVLVIAIVIGLQMVGVVLMSAILIAPSAAARQWTDRMGLVVVLGAVVGAIAGVSGALISATAERLPTGPTVVLCAAVLVVLSLMFAPNRGLIWEALRVWKNNRRLQIEAVLENLFDMASQHADPTHAHSISVLKVVVGGNVTGSLAELKEKGWVRQVSSGEWALTDPGVAEAKSLKRRGSSEDR